MLGIAHDPPPLQIHVVPGCRFVQHDFLNLDVTQSSYRRVLSFPVHNILDQIVEHRRCVWRLQDLFHQSGYEKYLCLFLVQCI